MSRHARDRARTPAALLVTVVLALVATGVALLLASGALTDVSATADDPDGRGTTVPPSASPTPTPTPPPDAVVTLVAAGDVLLHQPVISSARSGDGWDFAPLLAPLAPWVAGADLALCHLEVPVAPAGSTPSGYPVFGAPAAIADGLAATGWDGCSTASNHSVDRGLPGVVATLDALDAAGLGHVGTARDAAEGAAAQVYELAYEGQTVRVAHVAATYGTNGLPVPSDAPWSVTLLDPDGLVAQATAARAAGADVVVASVHFGVEYVSSPTDEQREVASALAASGVVDLVIGHHAHVPQSVELLPGGPRGTGTWVAFGLGNMVSNQDGACCTARTDSGLLLTASFRKPVGGVAEVTAVEWTPITVDRQGGHRVLALADVLAGTETLSGGSSAADRYARVVEVVGDAAPERTVPVTPGSASTPVVVPRPQTTSGATGTD